ncbi:glutathione peroxidase [Acholeplasma vituli]|uniref:Glutathione peroxidase n=1 Tax=Paracholeplasma vituli TaxID=69473 RepID=A0ABT2PVF0_9MOLU|nr:glutathione peroxidase [Paracholeplasma vituli]MCU0104919.1 glutathione peroxidase [Paracholeplasma vituli]
MSIYKFEFKKVNQQSVSMEQYKGKVLLIFNSATKCGYTKQYDAIEALYEKYHDKGLEVLDFPSNQFMNQAPGSSKEIASFCQMKFGTKFETFDKIDVNGKQAHPLFKFLRTKKAVDYPKTKPSLIDRLRGIDSIKWNFTKFLVDRNGNVVYRFSPSFTPEEMERFIKELI